MSDESFDNLSDKVDDLIDLCAEMKRENQMLKSSESSWNTEREQLMAKNQEAKTKLQSILDRLKSMDNAWSLDRKSNHERIQYSRAS